MQRAGPVRLIAAILFAIAWIINATGTVTNAWFSVTGLLLIGLACLALHQAGIGSAWVRRRYVRRGYRAGRPVTGTGVTGSRRSLGGVVTLQVCLP